jgi:hypothetical protein
VAVTDYSGLTILKPETGIQFTKVTDSSSDWTSVANDTYFYDKTDKIIYYKNQLGTILSIFSLGLNSAGSSYGLYSQTANSTNITNSTTEQTLIGSGLGSLSVPANGFKVGDSFSVRISGFISTSNNHTLTIKSKSGSVILATSGSQTFPVTTSEIWTLNLSFTIRSIGGAGVASIITSGNFINIKSSNGTTQGFSFSTLNNTTFDTTISNTLDITAQWGQLDAGDTIYSDNFVLNKTF